MEYLSDLVPLKLCPCIKHTNLLHFQGKTLRKKNNYCSAKVECSYYICKFNVIAINWYSPTVAHAVQSMGCGLLVEWGCAGYSGYSFSLLWI